MNWARPFPTTKEEYDLYMQPWLSLDGGEEFPVHDFGHDLTHTPQSYYQLTAESEKVWFDLSEHKMSMTIRIDPRWEHDMNRSPYRYRDEYRGEAESWGPVPWDSFQA